MFKLRNRNALRQENDRLRSLLASVYIGPAAVHDLPEAWRDAFYAASLGLPFTEPPLPYTHPEPGTVRELKRLKAEHLAMMDLLQKRVTAEDRARAAKAPGHWLHRINRTLAKARAEGEL